MDSRISTPAKPGADRARRIMFHKPIPIADGVFQFRAIGARVTVLVEDGEALVVDAGLPGSAAVILRGLKGLGLGPEQLSRVVLTHYHPDHAGGLAQLVDGRPVGVAVHRLEADIIEGVERLPGPFAEGKFAGMTQSVMAKLMGQPVPVDDRLEDGGVIPFGTEVRVVHVPGHTGGSIALHLPSKGTLIVGDALQYKLARKLSPPIVRETQSLRRAIRSLARLAGLDFDTICFSHFPPLRREPREALRQLVAQYDG